MDSQLITIAISTTSKKFDQIILPYRDKEVNYLIIVQGVMNEKSIETPSQLKHRGDANFIYCSELGLSKSRNIAIDRSTGDYLQFMDDDVAINVSGIKSLVTYMKENQCHIATGTYITTSGLVPKKYRVSPFRHNFFTAAHVSSIEICVHRKFILTKSIYFDSNFGLGSKLPSGEEFIFITDALRAGFSAFFFPSIVGIHPDITSGDDFFSTASKIRAKREMLRRVFGKYSLFFSILFWLKKIHKVSTLKHAINFTSIMLSR